MIQSAQYGAYVQIRCEGFIRYSDSLRWWFTHNLQRINSAQGLANSTPEFRVHEPGTSVYLAKEIILT